MINYTGFNKPGNDVMYSLILLYCEIGAICLSILLVVVLLLIFIIKYFSVKLYIDKGDDVDYWPIFLFSIIPEKKNNYRRGVRPYYFTHKEESTLDIFFVIIPTLIIGYILVPTIGFLYSYNINLNLDNLAKTFTIDIVGNQWYWTYGYNIALLEYHALFNVLGEDTFFTNYTYTSIMDTSTKVLWECLNTDNFITIPHLLTVDNPLVIPQNVYIEISLTSEDVLHSWALPQLAIKVDAIPGRVTTFNLISNVQGVFYGQCSELCGVGHGFMPITLHVISIENFQYYAMYLGNFDLLLLHKIA